MKAENFSSACSFCKWYPRFKKNSLEATIVPLPKDVCKYLEDDAFVMPLEATTKSTSSKTEWHDGTTGEDDDDVTEIQPSFPEFSKQVQKIIDNFGAVFIKTNWSSPWDATWVAPTKTLKCTSLEEVYLLLKSSNKISQDLNIIKNIQNEDPLLPCLVLKRWRDIDPCKEFRCFVVNKELVGICQRDVSQYYKYIEKEKYDIQNDIKSLFSEKIKDQFPLQKYLFDVIRHKKDVVKIIDFGPLNESAIEKSLFTYEELQNITETPEFRFIAEKIGIQPTSNQHYCAPKEINEFFQATSGLTLMDSIKKEIEKQNQEVEKQNQEKNIENPF